MQKVVVAVLVLLLALGVGWLMWSPAESRGVAQPDEPAAAATPPPGTLTMQAPSATDETALVEIASALERTELPFDTPPVVSKGGTGRVHGKVVWQDTKEAIVEVEVRLVLATWANSARARTVTTDAAGAFAFEDVVANHYSVISALGGVAEIDVESGGDKQVRVAVPRGARVSGVVRDEQGQPVRAADIWMSEEYNADMGTTVARSDAAGKFEITSAYGRRWVGARARGYRGSAVSLVEAKLGELRRLEIVLVRNDARVRGFVRDSTGKACAEAVVMASPPGEGKWQLGIDGSQQRAWTPVVGKTDGAGAFALEGLQPGELSVRAHTLGLGKAVVSVSVAAGASADVMLSLPVAARVEGRVTDGSGAAVAGVICYFAALHDIDFVWARSDGEGRFVAEDVSPGELPVQLWHQKRLALSTTLSLSPGQARVWNPVLGASAGLRGRVVDSTQQPLANFSVVAFRDAKGVGETKTDAEGRFAFDSLELASLTLRVGVAPGGGAKQTRLTVLTVPDVIPPRDDLLLVVPDDKLPSVTLLGRVTRADGAPAIGASVRIGGADARGVVDTSVDANGAFRLSQVLPGSYWISVHDADHPTLQFGQRALAPHSTTDLGELRLIAGGRIVVTTRYAGGVDDANVQIEVLDAEHRAVGILQRAGDTLRSPVLPPGQLVLVISGGRIARARHELALQAGEDKRIELVVEPGLHRVVHVQLPAESPVPRWVSGTLYTDGKSVGSCAFKRAEDGSWSTDLWLAARDHEIWVGAEGQKVSGHVAIPASLPSGSTVGLSLR